MKLELSPLIIFLLATIPSFFVFLAMNFRERSINIKVKDLEQQSLANNERILELEHEIVTIERSSKTLKKDPLMESIKEIEQRKAVF